MAVVQISRIQVRRGQKNTTGLPQLASGELAWAVDTQELYIGNGSVAEGSPAVGNTKILTQQDLSADGNILNLLQYQYKVLDSSIMTGVDSNHPVMRTLQDRLDDRISSAEFGCVGDGSDNTVSLQRAIDQLFLNTTKASNTSLDGVVKRITLEIPAGTYVITDTLYIPSYATIVGGGSNKTIIEYQGTGNAIEFVNDSSVAGTPNVDATTSVNQPKFIKMSGLTIRNTNDTTGIYVHTVRDSTFDDIVVAGTWVSGTTGSKGIDLNVLSTAITTERNMFSNVSVSGFEYGIYSNSDIINNTFDNVYISGVKRGIAFSDTTLDVGSTFGPRKNTITKCNFSNIKQQGVYVGNGTGNTVKDCKFTLVGNDGGAVTSPLYPQVYFKQAGNSVANNEFDRQAALAKITASPYIPEVTGNGEMHSFSTNRIALPSNPNTQQLAFRLPVSTTDVGVPAGQVTYVINYTYHSSVSGFLRRGTMTLATDVSHNYKQLADEYEFAGPSDPSGFTAIHLDFSVEFLTQSGSTYTGTGLPYSIAINYINPLAGDSGYFTYSYQTIFYREV